MTNSALWDIHEARKRVDEVVVVVYSPSNDLVGVSSVFPAAFGPGSDVYLTYRMFIRPADRVPGLMKAVTRYTRCIFENQPAWRDSARGMLIYAENPKLMREGVRRLFEQSVWKYADRDERGVDIWKFDFTD